MYSMVAENEIAPVGIGAEGKSDTRLDSVEKSLGSHPDEGYKGKIASGRPATGRVGHYLGKFEQQLVEFNLEARGLERVHESERLKKTTWISYLQTSLLWVSMNLAANNITLGMLGPVTYALSFRDSALCAVFGALVGALIAAWMATWGPISGLRTMAFGRYAMGWWPSKIVVILNLIQMIGYSLIDCVIGGQILSAVSPHGSMSVAVGVVIIAIISWVVATFGIHIFHYYERFAWLPQLIVICILFGVSSSKFDLTTPSTGDPRTLAGNRLSFFSLCLSSAITYAPLAADFFVYYPATTSKSAIYTLTTTGLMISFTMAYMIGIGLASGIATNESYNAAYTVGAGALIVEGFSPLHDFGKFCAVVVALGLIGNTIAPTYCAGVDFQVLGRYAEKVPRVVWTTVAVVIYTVCALAGRSHLSEIFTNFLALMGYWVFIWVGILFEERHIFRCRRRRRCQRSISVNGSSVTEPYNWDAWNDPSKLPVGIAGFIAFGVGWVGAVLCMAQVWYIGPLAKLVGDYGADMGNYVGVSWAGLVYPPLRYVELRVFGR